MRHSGGEDIILNPGPSQDHLVCLPNEQGMGLNVFLAELTGFLWRTRLLWALPLSLLLTCLRSFLYLLLHGFPGDCDLDGVGDLWGHELHVRCDTFHPTSVFSLRIMVAAGAWGLLGKNQGPFLDHPQPASRKENPSLTWN